MWQYLWRRRFGDRGSNKQYMLIPPLISLLRHQTTTLSPLSATELLLPDAGGADHLLRSSSEARAGFLKKRITCTQHCTYIEGFFSSFSWAFIVSDI